MGKPNIIIFEDLTQEHPFGWVLYWQVKDDFSKSLAGNAPIIIEKETLNVYCMMTAISVEENIELYKSDKNKLLQLEEDEDGFFDPVNR